MDLTTLWQEQKTFILYVIGGLLVFFLGQALISSLYGVDESRRRVQSLESSLRRTPAPARSQLDEVRDRNEDLNARYETAVEHVAFRPDPKYVLSPKEKPDIQYDRLYNEARDTLVEGAKTLNITVDDSLGMPELSPTRRSEIQRALTALDIVTRVALLAIEAHVSQVDSIAMVPEAGRRQKSFVREQRVKFKMKGTSAAMAEFFKRFVLQEKFLAIENVHIEVEDPDGAWVEADVTVSALEVIKEESES
ncbi:MAG: hypothetical protein ACYTG7_21300 [Planctomycetota bacterium]|jgi:hypothetical protein